MTNTASPRGATARNLELLRCIASGPTEFSLSALAERTALPASTVHRILDQWVKRDVLVHEGAKSYRMGPELFRLAALIGQRFELRRLARPVLIALSKEWQETAALCVFNPAQRSGTIAESVVSPQPLKYELTVNSVVSLAWGSLGRAILAHLPSPDIDAVCSRDAIGPLSRSPLPPRKTMLRELAAIRARRYALYHDPAIGVAGVSAPLLQADGRILGSVGVIMPASRFTRAMQDRLAAAVVHSARKLGAAAIG